MMPPVPSFIAMALAGIACIPSAASGTSTTLTSTAPSPISTPSGIEVDVIFPIQNATYNDTESLPVVFALQNLTAASAYGPFWFNWGIVPYFGGSNVYADTHINAYWETRFTTANTTTQPYIVVNQTDVQEWQFGVAIEGELYGFALEWAIQWETCDYPPVNGTVIFYVVIGSPEPDLGRLVGTCPQLGGSFQISSNNSSCPAVVNNTAIGNPCAVDLNETTVASISSSVQSLITASAAAASAASATASDSATSTSSPAAHNSAFGCNVSSPYVFIVTALCTLLLMISL